MVAVASAGLSALVASAQLAVPSDGAGASTDAVGAVVSLFRAAAAALSAYVAVSAAAVVVSSAAGCPRRGLASAMPAVLRRILFGSSLALVSTAPLMGGSAAAAPERKPPTMVLVERPPAVGLDPRAIRPEPAPPEGTPADRAEAPEEAIGEQPSGAPRVGPVQPEPAPAAPDALTTWTVRSGDHFWSIAEAVVARDLGRAGAEAEVRARWLSLIELNAGQLVEPGNPDLLLPGQNLRLPGG